MTEKVNYPSLDISEDDADSDENDFEQSDELTNDNDENLRKNNDDNDNVSTTIQSRYNLRKRKRPLSPTAISKPPPPKKIQTKLPERQPKSSNTKFLLITIIIILVVSVGWFFVQHNPKWFSSGPDQKKLLDEFFIQTEPILSPIGQRTVRTAIRKAVSTDEDRSIILLIIGTKSQLLKNFSKKLANLTVSLKDENPESIPDPYYLDTIDNGEEIETIYHQTFVEEKRPVVIFENLESMPPSIAMYFHQFVDNDQSKIRSTFSIVTLKSDLVKNFDIEQTNVDMVSSEILRNLWNNQYDNDGMESLINRIAEYSVIL